MMAKHPRHVDRVTESALASWRLALIGAAAPALALGALVVIWLLARPLVMLPIQVVSSLVEIIVVVFLSISWLITQPHVHYYSLSLVPAHRRGQASDVVRPIAAAIPIVVLAFFQSPTQGLLGVLVAIPLAAALRVLVLRIVTPAIRHWSGAAEPEDAPTATTEER